MADTITDQTIQVADQQEQITWTNDEIEVGILYEKQWGRNPRYSTEEDLEGLDKSFSIFGQVETIAIGPTDNLYNGHQRVKYLYNKHGKHLKVAVRRSSRELTEQEKEQLVLLLHAGATGRWDYKKLSEWDKETLEAFGLGSKYTEKLMDDFQKLNEIFGESEEDQEEGEKSDGSQLSLLDITIEDPKHQVERGQVWQMGEHVLVCANVLTEWSTYIDYLVDDVIFAPYPGPFVPLSKVSELRRIIMVQPDPYICGHILDRYEEINGDEAIAIID